MKMYEFSIIASGLDPSRDDFETRFYDAGCDDATVSFQKGHIILDFGRQADSVSEAIASAIECVKKAGAHVDRVEPDPLVNLSEIGSRIGMTRSAMSQYSNGQRGNGDFPAPVAKITSETPLWSWSEVARWLWQNKKISREIAIEAEAVREANEAIECDESDIGNRLREKMLAYEAAI